MNSRERILTAAKGGIPDIVPVAPYIGNYGASVANVAISQYNTNGKTMAEAQAKAWEVLKLDCVVAQSDNYYIAQAFGVEINQPYDDTPHVTKTAISHLSEVDKLPEINVYNDGRMYVYLEAVSRLREIFGNDVAVRSAGTGMFSLAAHALGTQEFLIQIALAEADEDEHTQQLIMSLLEYITNCLIKFSTAIIEAGCDFVVCGDSSASPDLISPDIYRKYVLPFEKRYFEQMKTICKKYNAVSLLHICGDTTPILKFMAECGSDIIEIDHKVNLDVARKIVGEDICIMGNLDPTSILLYGKPIDVEIASINAINSAGKNGNFILGSGCEVAHNTPIENIKTMLNVGHKHSY